MNKIFYLPFSSFNRPKQVTNQILLIIFDAGIQQIMWHFVLTHGGYLTRGSSVREFESRREQGKNRLQNFQKNIVYSKCTFFNKKKLQLDTVQKLKKSIEITKFEKQSPKSAEMDKKPTKIGPTPKISGKMKETDINRTKSINHILEPTNKR